MIERELQARVSWVSSEERWGCREKEELMSINTAKLVRCWHWHTVSSWGVIVKYFLNFQLFFCILKYIFKLTNIFLYNFQIYFFIKIFSIL